MSGGGLAGRYIQPLFDVALENKELDRIDGDLKSLNDALLESPEFKGFLFNPSLDRRIKKSTIEEVFAKSSKFTINFIRVVIDKNRPEVFVEAYPRFHELLNQHKGITPGLIETAVPLKDELMKEIKQMLEKRFECALDIEQKVDETLLGGIRVRVGNRIIDGTLKGRLAQLRSRMTGQ